MPSALAYRPDIDGLRALAVLAVVFHHLSASLVPGGYVGVDVFFVISGYLITKILRAEMEAGTFSLAGFYARRVRRIFPAMSAVVASVLIVGWFIYLPSNYIATLRAAIATVLFSSNILSWRDLQDGYFAEDARLNPLLHMWSLGVEEQFYLLFPIALFLCVRYAKRWLVPLLATAALLSLASSAALISSKSVAVFFLSPFRAWELLVGSLVAVTAMQQPSSPKLREWLAWASLLAILVPVFAYTPDTVFPGIAALPPVLGTAMLIHLGMARHTQVSRLLSWRPAVAIGLMSYSLYLWHWPVIVFAEYQLQESLRMQWLPALLAISLALAWLSYRFIEQPARLKSSSVGRRSVLWAGAGTMVIFVAIGIYGIKANGFPTRWPARSIAVDLVRTSPELFRNCETHANAHGRDLCVIGDTSAKPDALLWGDSHLRAWLPGFDLALRQAGRSAWVAANSACPPLVGIEDPADVDCNGQNNAVLDSLHEHPEIRQVVLAAFWSKYFSPSNMELSAALGGTGNPVVAPGALRHTLQAVASKRREVIVLGPVPAYPYDVTLALARNFAGIGREPVRPMIQDVHQDNALFYATVGQAQIPDVRFVDVARWMCQPDCHVYEQESLYSDSNHLSTFGARRYSGLLAGVLSGITTGAVPSPIPANTVPSQEISRWHPPRSS